MNIKTAEIIVDVKNALGEGPSWDEANGKVIWVDIPQKQLHTYHISSEEHKVYEMPHLISAAMPAKNGQYVVTLQDGLYLFDLESKQFTLLGDPEPDNEDTRFNDAKCDPKGRLWLGTMSMTGKAGAGSLYRYDGVNQFTSFVSNVSISNGMAWSPDHKIMYYIDSVTRQVSAFDYDMSAGKIDNRRTVCELPAGPDVPDGMTIDNEGMIWVAHWDGYKVTRWNPHNGELIGQVDVPAARVTSCVFAGPDRSDLYITTSRESLSEEELEKYPLSGGLFRVRTEYKGAPTYLFEQ